MDKFKLDANETAFFNRQLESIKSRTYDTKQKALKATTLLPVSTEANTGADFITYRSFTAVGMAKIVSDYAHDFPRVDVYGEEKTVKIKSLGDSYGYSIKEIRRAQLAGTDLNPRRAAAARRAIDELIDRIAWSGDSEYSIEGFINFQGAIEVAINGGVWSGKTSDEIIADVTSLTNAIVDITNGVEVPNTLLMPISQFNLIKSKRMEGNSDRTVLTYIRENFPELTTIDWLTELKGAGEGGADRLLAYTMSPEHLTLEIPQQFEMFAEQAKGMEYVIPCHAETAGVIVYYPLSVARMDGI